MHFKIISIQSIIPNPNQPRKHFDLERLQELANSIESQGLIEPLIVRPEAEDKYGLVAGERRWRAAQMVGLTNVPCVVVGYDDQQAAAVSLIENIQRADLTLIEEAEGYQQLQRQFNFQQEDIAKIVGKSRSHITNLLRLLTLDSTVQAWVASQKLSFGHARTLVGLSKAEQRRFGLLAQQRHWSVRQMESQIKEHKQMEQSPNTPEDADIKRLEVHLSEHLGTPVVCQPNDEQGGWLKIKYYDHDTLAGILSKLGVDTESLC
ncbi:ParB/RepB/Spo0J family partition protein [Legionella sp. W05-934-2]|jgi:ParB family chromosome partitioning protein|uniref:ParB/RepB/Spo0J family partition protein n=1 Tax=Legionella sp. W05-934-2 TaxID=1198649 RepID=UPI003462B11B